MRNRWPPQMQRSMKAPTITMAGPVFVTTPIMEEIVGWKANGANRE